VTCRDVASDGSRGGSPAGNRGAPPRGVDVKPLGRRGRPGPWELPGGLPDPVRGGPPAPVPGTRILGSWDPRPQGALEGPGGPRTRSPGSGTSREGGFYINPSRRGPAVPRGGPGDLGVPGGPKRASGRPLAARPPPGASQAPPGNRGAPARGVDVKPPSRRGPGPGKPHFLGFLRKIPIFGQNRGFHS